MFKVPFIVPQTWQNNTIKQNRRENDMRGYVTDAGYMGMVNGKYMLFSSEEDYRDYISE